MKTPNFIHLVLIASNLASFSILQFVFEYGDDVSFGMAGNLHGKRNLPEGVMKVEARNGGLLIECSSGRTVQSEVDCI